MAEKDTEIVELRRQAGQAAVSRSIHISNKQLQTHHERRFVDAFGFSFGEHISWHAESMRRTYETPRQRQITLIRSSPRRMQR